MKNIVLTLIISFLTLIATAQEAKPTKEQTIEFIVNKLKGYNANFLNPDDEPKPYTLENADIIFDNYLLTIITYEVWENQKTKRQYKYILNLKDVEKIFFEKTNDNYVLYFSAYNSKKLISKEVNKTSKGITHTGINYQVSGFGIPAPNDEKLVQAFNHLRKLCGAPEPIKF